MPRISFQEEDLKNENDTTSPTEGGKPEEVSLTKYGKLKKFVFDAYAVRESPTTLVGVFVTVLVILATVVYLAVVLYQTLTAPLTQTASVFWTIGAGPFPAQLVCTAFDGCYVSNLLSVKWATQVALSVDTAQTGCMFMSFGQTYTFNITFSNSPLDGLQVIYNGTNVDTSKVPAGFGALVNSQANCFGQGLAPPVCVNGVQIIPSPVGPGFTLLTYVETDNLTVSHGPASLRREWFLGKFSNESVIVPGSTPCLTTLPQSLLSNADMVQARLRFNTFYTVQTISKANPFLVLFGSVGGAYSLFIQFGSLLISCMSIWMIVSSKTQVVREKVIRSLTMSMSMRRPVMRGGKVVVHDEDDLMEKGKGQVNADEEEKEFQRYMSQTSKNRIALNISKASAPATAAVEGDEIPVKPLQIHSKEIKASPGDSKIVADMKTLSESYGCGSGHMTGINLEQLAALSQVETVENPQLKVESAAIKEHPMSNSGNSSYLSVGSESSVMRMTTHPFNHASESLAKPAVETVHRLAAATRPHSSPSIRSNKVVPAAHEGTPHKGSGGA